MTSDPPTEREDTDRGASKEKVPESELTNREEASTERSTRPVREECKRVATRASSRREKLD
jgi:hypothetical protein